MHIIKDLIDGNPWEITDNDLDELLDRYGRNTVKYLDCTGCNITRINGLNNLTTLICVENYVLESIYDVPSLININVAGCIRLNTIMAPKLKSLNCDNCIALPDLHYANLELLNCANCEFSSIRAPKLDEINCENCVNLDTDFSSFKNILKINCISCPNIYSLKIEDTPVKSIDCSNCLNLGTISESRSLTKLICNDSPIKKIGKFPRLKILECRNVNIFEELGITDINSYKEYLKSGKRHRIRHHRRHSRTRKYRHGHRHSICIHCGLPIRTRSSHRRSRRTRRKSRRKSRK